MFPHYSCPFCGVETPDGSLCKLCKQSEITGKVCKSCGESITGEGDLCIQCKAEGRKFTAHRSVMKYDGVTSPAILKLKFKDAKYLAIDFAKLLAQKFVCLGWNIDLVCSVPSHSNRMKQRGYNQAKEIAVEFCKLANLTYYELLTKTKDTGHQLGSNRAERLKNLQGSFAVTDKWACKGKSILVIDDVFTTGSTMETCAVALKKAGASKVYCMSVAKTPYILSK